MHSVFVLDRWRFSQGWFSTALTQVSGEGMNSVELRALDNAGNISALVNSAVNIDLTAPTVGVSAFPSVLWPANGKMVPVAVYGAITDKLSGVDLNNAFFAVVDEYGKVQPSGRVKVDRLGLYAFVIWLQASRNDSDKDGRHYTITVGTRDLAGNLGSGATVVTVPHDHGH